MEEIIKSLSSLDKQIEDAKRNVAVQEGRMKETMQQLKNEFDIDNIEDAIKMEGESEIELEKIKINIETKFADLRAEYEW